MSKTNHGPKCLYCDKPIRKTKASSSETIDKPGHFSLGHTCPELWHGYGWPDAAGLDFAARDTSKGPAPYFCSLRCGMYFGRFFAQTGERLQGKTGGTR